MKPGDAGRIDVVGGGIGGLAVAAALFRDGFDVHVHEAAPSYAHVGGGHWLYANALHALSRIDPALPADLRALGTTFDGFRFATPSQRTLFFETVAPYVPSPELAPLVLHRADIIDQLARRLPPERLHFGRRLARWTPEALVFEDGSEVPARLVIAADGIHSRVRRDAITPTPPRFSGQTGLWGISDHTLPGDSGAFFTELWGNGLRMGFTAVGTQGVYWFMVVRDEDIPTDPDAIKAFILGRAATFPEELVAAVHATPAPAIHVNPLFDVTPPARWHTDQVCAIGDAVHACTPNLGQGGCQAIEDAVCLAEMLRTQPDAPTAFAAYERTRRRKATAVVYLSRWLGNLAQSRGRLRCALRDLLVWLGPAALVRPVLRWIMVPRRGPSSSSAPLG